MRIRMAVSVLQKITLSVMRIERRAVHTGDTKVLRSARSALKRLTTEWEVILD